MGAVTPAERDAIHAAQGLIVRRFYDPSLKLGDTPDIDADLLRAARVACLDSAYCPDRRMACCQSCTKS